MDINVVDRYQDVYPTKQQTGVELFELVHMASVAFARVAVYFEDSISPLDMRLLAAAAATPREVQRKDGAVSLECSAGLGLRWEGPVLMDGAPWPFHSRDTVWVPKGKHVVQGGSQELPLRVVAFNGTLLQARWTGSGTEFEYERDSRAAALVEGTSVGAWADGKPVPSLAAGDHTTLLLPRGRHRVVIQALRKGVLQTAGVVP